MADRAPISVFIIAKDEADRIGRAIESVKGWVDEVLVIDSGSSDHTVSLCEEMGARTYFNPWTGFGPQKIFGEEHCRNDWVLNIDADEEIGESLKVEILAMFESGSPECAAYRLARKFVMIGEERPHLLAPKGYWTRLYNRKHAGFKDSPVHDSVTVREGETGTLKGVFYHRALRSLEHLEAKLEAYSTMQAQDMFDKGRRPPLARLWAEPWTMFFKSYFLRGYCVYGLSGVHFAWIYAQGRRARLAKARKLFAEARP